MYVIGAYAHGNKASLFLSEHIEKTLDKNYNPSQKRVQGPIAALLRLTFLR
jgi:hypothetical protein